MEPIEQGIVSRHQFNSSITFYLLQNYKHSLLITKVPLFLEFFSVVLPLVQRENFEMTDLILNLNKCLMLDVGVVRKLLILSLCSLNSHYLLHYLL